MNNWIVVKRNRTLMVVDGDGNIVYSPPFFVRVNHRTDFHQLLENMKSAENYIDAVIAFEVKFTRYEKRK